MVSNPERLEYFEDLLERVDQLMTTPGFDQTKLPGVGSVMSDIFTKTFNELYFGSNSTKGGDGEYSIYRDKNTGEVKYYDGELPLKRGLPDNIEEGTPEAFAYKQEQIDVWGLPGEIISDDNIAEVKKKRQETVITDPDWASKMLYSYMEPEGKGFKSDQEAS